MSGYWDNIEATKTSIRDGGFGLDIGALDEEGFLTLKDRSKDLIISEVQIFIHGIEEVLLKHPSIYEVAEVGKPHVLG